MDSSILPLETYEASPEFQSYTPEDRDAFYTGYWSASEKAASNEDDYNSILKQKADRAKSAVQTNYLAKHPEDTELDEEKINADPALKGVYSRMKENYGELDYNVNKSKDNAKSFSADDMEDPSRSFAYKPYQYSGQRGYTVKYPDGTIELIPGVTDESQLTEFIRKKRLDKFNGKREGILDSNNPLADSEFDSIYDKIRKTDSGIYGAINGVRQRVSSMLQGFDVSDISNNQSLISQKEQGPKKIQELRAKYETLKKNGASKDELDAAQEDADNYERDLATASSNVLTDSSVEGYKTKKAEAFTSLAKEMKFSESLRGNRVQQMFQDNINSYLKENQGDASNISDYFGEHPEDFIPYVIATSSSSIPDMAAIIGTAAVAGVASGGNPVVAGAAAGAVGFELEYTGTLLSEMQERAANENKNLYDKGVMDSIMADENFMAGVQQKAIVRAGIIAGFNAVTGGASELIAKKVSTSMGRVATALGVDMLTESGGELAAQAATESKINWIEVANEGLGAFAGASISAARGEMGHAAKEAKANAKPDNVTEAAGKASNDVAEAARQAASANSNSERVKAMADKYGIKKEEPTQSTENPEIKVEVKEEPAPTIVKKASTDLAAKKTTESIDKKQPEPVAVNQAKDYFNEEQNSKYPLGSFRPKYQEEKLKYLSDDDLSSSHELALKNLNNIEDDRDKNISAYDGESDKRKKLFLAQLKFDELDLEKFRRSRSDIFVGDLFADFSERASKLEFENPHFESRQVAEARIIFEIIKEKGMTDDDAREAYSYVGESNLGRSDDYAEVLGFRAQSAKKWASYFLSNPVSKNNDSIIELKSEKENVTEKYPEPVETDKRAEVPYKINGIQKGFGPNDDYIPLYQLVTINDPEHYFDGSTITVPLTDGQATHEAIMKAIENKKEQEFTGGDRRAKADFDNPSDTLEDEYNIESADQLTEKAPGLLFKALDWYHTLKGNNPNKPNSTNLVQEDAKRRVEAAAALKTGLNRSVFSLLSETDSYNRIMGQVRDSNYDSTATGSLMSVLGVEPSDTNRRVITNVLGNYWSAGPNGVNKNWAPYMYNGLVLSNAIDTAYRAEANVDVIYEMDSPNEISQEDLIIAMAPDGLDATNEEVDDQGKAYPVQASIYGLTETAQESTDTFNAQFQGRVIRLPDYNPNLNDKYQEAKALDRPGINVIKLSKVEGNSLEQAMHIISQLKNNYVVKDTDGKNSEGVYYSASFRTPKDLAAHISNMYDSGKQDRIYFESAVLPTKKNKDAGKSFNDTEHRVHLYIDKDGKAHAFRNLTFKKSDYFNQERQGTSFNPDYDTFFLVPSNHNSPEIKAMQQFAEKALSGKDHFKDTIVGLDMSEANVDGKDGHVIFEANALTYGMSGWLGNPVSMSEIISEMTGKPSVLAGLYELAKTQLTKDQLTEIKSRIDEGMPAEYAAFPEYYDMINRGVELFNKFLPSAKWLEAMKNLFNMPVKALIKLYTVITSVFRGSVDRKFELNQPFVNQGKSKSSERRASDASKSKALNKQYLTPSKTDKSIGGYIAQVLQHPQLNEAQKSLLKYIQKKVQNSVFKDTKVGATRKDYNFYSSHNKKIGIDVSTITPRIAIHEIVHAVTSDFLQLNIQRASNIINGDVVDLENAKEIAKIHAYIIDPRNADELSKHNVSKDYINLVETYTSYLDSIGQGGPDTKLGAGASSYEYQSKSKDIHYAATNIDEFLTETLTRKEFQEALSKMKPTKGNSRSMFSQIMRAISRVLGLPFHKDSLLYQAVTESVNIISNKKNDAYAKDSYFDLQPDGTYIMRSAPENELTNINGTRFASNEVSGDTKDMAKNAVTDEQKETVENIANEESIQARLSQLRADNPDIKDLEGIEPIAANLPAMREVVIDKLNEDLEANPPKPGEKIKMTAKRLEYINKLQKNKALGLASLSKWIHDPRITDGQASILLDSMDYLLEESEDVENLSTVQLRYYVNVLQSMSDGGPPIGFKHIAKKMFIKKQVNILNHIRKNEPNRVHLQAPINNRRGEIAFGLFSHDLGSTVQLSSEVAYMGLSESGHQFLKDFLGFYKDNIDLQQLEERSVKEEFYSLVKKAFPKGMSQLDSKRIGSVARLTQYERSKADPPKQILSRLRQVQEGIEVEQAHNKDDGDLSKVALTQILGGQDLSLLPDEKAIISFLESRLTAPEKMVLDKIREIGKAYLPTLQTVKAITKQSVLQDFENYVHDSNVTPMEKSEQNLIRIFDSMSDILHNRKGINIAEKTTYANLDITAIADNQIKSSTYEKHTGIQRYLVANALGPTSQLTALLDSDTHQIRKPITNRLKSLIAGYHTGMTTSQHMFTGIWGITDAAVNLYIGTKIIGVNAFIKNTVSATIARMSLLSLSRDAILDSVAYDTHSTEIKQFLKNHFPTQYNRTSEYDVIDGQRDKYTASSKIKRNMDIGDAPFWAFAKALPGVPRSTLAMLSDNVTSKLSNLSNGLPEKQAAFGMWTAAYVHYMKKNGTATSMADFLANKQIDRRAANDASDFVSRSLGYSPDKASKGTYWNGSTATKKILSKAFSIFRQQATGLSIEFQNNIQKSVRLAASGNIKESKAALQLALVGMSNSMSFRALTIILGSSMFYGGLDRYFSGDDDEEKKRQLLETQRKYKENANRNNARDFLSESLLMLLPIATSAPFVENAVAATLDASDASIQFTGFNELTPYGFSVELKKNLKLEIESLDEKIKAKEKAIKTATKYGLNTLADEQELEKLELAKSQLTENTKFKYFPTQGAKAYLDAWGGYGIAAEGVVDTIKDLIGPDLTKEENQQIHDYLNNELAYVDPLADNGFTFDQINNFAGYARKLIPTEWIDKEERNIPNTLFWAQYFKAGMNPKIVIERTRQAMANEAVKARNAARKKAEKLNERWADKYN